MSTRCAGLGEVFADGVAYVLSRDPDEVRVPDASFVSRDRIPASGVPVGYWLLAPDLAVEVVSPNDRAEEVHNKVQVYLSSGVRTVWVLWPRSRSVSTHERDGLSRELGADDDLEGGDALPGFRVRVG
ncbi:MAG: Uma2 family endonuclease [Chloroflexia bacterium]